MRALVIEDDYVSGKVIKKMLSVYGECDVASSGEKGLAMFFEAVESGKKYDVICLDIMMPEMDGYEATREIRKFNERVAIIAQTAYGLSGDREKAMEAGCNDYIAKPLKKEYLVELMRKIFKHSY